MRPSGRWRIHAAALHYFEATRRAGSIREAARRLNVASSAVNRQILALEADLGSPLFERLASGLRLTAAGEALARHVITVLRDAQRLRSELDALRGLRGGHVELVAPEGLCHRIIPAAIAAAARAHPQVTTGVTILATSDIAGAIANGDADLGLAFEVPPRPGLRRLVAARFRLGAVLPADAPATAAASLTLSELANTPLILPKANFANHAQLLPLLAQAGLQNVRRCDAGSIELMKQLVLRGLGAACMTRIGLEDALEAGQLVHVPLRHGRGFLSSELLLLARAPSPLSLAAETLAAALTAELSRAKAAERTPS
jgi:DNA-binding transcriptional LysR family regulator